MPWIIQRTSIEDKWENWIDPEDQPEKNHSKEMYADNVFSHDAEDPNPTNLKKNILLTEMLQTISRTIEKMLERWKKNRWPII